LFQTEANGVPKIAISVFSKNRIRHILLSTPDNQWCIRQVGLDAFSYNFSSSLQIRKPTLSGLIEHHMDNKIPVHGDGTLLTTPIPRPNHIILHDHVFVGKKLGSGAFGVCHAGGLKIGEMTHDVAIKKFKGMMHKKDRMEFVKVCFIQ
jgi:hypothetical protein